MNAPHVARLKSVGVQGAAALVAECAVQSLRTAFFFFLFFEGPSKRKGRRRGAKVLRAALQTGRATNTGLSVLQLGLATRPAGRRGRAAVGPPP